MVEEESKVTATSDYAIGTFSPSENNNVDDTQVFGSVQNSMYAKPFNLGEESSHEEMKSCLSDLSHMDDIQKSIYQDKKKTESSIPKKKKRRAKKKKNPNAA